MIGFLSGLLSPSRARSHDDESDKEQEQYNYRHGVRPRRDLSILEEILKDVWAWEKDAGRWS